MSDDERSYLDWIASEEVGAVRTRPLKTRAITAYVEWWQPPPHAAEIEAGPST
jgi:hypothetical protein